MPVTVKFVSDHGWALAIRPPAQPLDGTSPLHAPSPPPPEPADLADGELASLAPLPDAVGPAFFLDEEDPAGPPAPPAPRAVRALARLHPRRGRAARRSRRQTSGGSRTRPRTPGGRAKRALGRRPVARRARAR